MNQVWNHKPLKKGQHDLGLWSKKEDDIFQDGYSCPEQKEDKERSYLQVLSSNRRWRLMIKNQTFNGRRINTWKSCPTHSIFWCFSFTPYSLERYTRIKRRRIALRKVLGLSSFA